MYKIVFIDLDGTLLNSYSQITDETKQVLLNAQEKGTIIVLASGRVSSSTSLFAKQIGLDSYVISGNGAIITDLKTDEDIYRNLMSRDTALRIVQICDENSINYNLYTLNEVFTKKIVYSALFYNMENKKLSPDRKIKINICNNMLELLKNNPDMLVSKITICDEDKSVFDSIIRKLRANEDVTVLDVSHSSRKMINVGSETVEVSYYYTEVSKKDANKSSAIEYLINKLNIGISEVIAIGDNANDVEMVKKAGLGVIMNNAAPKYKEAADYIAPSNDENGVADVINKFVLES